MHAASFFRASPKLVFPVLAIFILLGLQAGSVAAQADFLAGTWTGTWMSGFGNGTMTLDVQIDSDNRVTGEVTLTGVIFSDPGPHPSFIMEGTIDPDVGVTLTDPDNPIYGPLTITIGVDGSVTASAPNVPSSLITSATGQAQINFMNRTAMGNGTPTPDFGGNANSTFMITLSSPQRSPFFFPQIGEGTVGNIVFDTLLALENTAGVESQVTVDFFSTPNGDPMQVNLIGRGTASSFDLTLSAGETIFLQTPGTTVPLQVGYARITAPSGVSGTAIFTRRDGGTTVTKAGVPAETERTDFSTLVDTRGANNVGLALVRPPAGGNGVQGSAAVTLRLYDTDFNLMGTRNIQLAPGAHLARFVTDGDFFGDVTGVDEMTGSVTVESNEPIVAAVLLQDDDASIQFPDEVPILTAFPAISGRADQGGTSAQIRSQEIVARVSIPAAEEEVAGAIYQVHAGNAVLGRFLRTVPAGLQEETFEVPLGIDASRLSVTVQFIYRNGEESGAIRLPTVVKK